MWYIIINKKTGKWLPENRRVGWRQYCPTTHIELDNKKPPRLFLNKRSAVSTLMWWLKGPLGFDGLKEDNSPNMFSLVRYYSHLEPRIKEDMEIVPANVLIKPLNMLDKPLGESIFIRSSK